MKQCKAIYPQLRKYIGMPETKTANKRPVKNKTKLVIKEERHYTIRTITGLLLYICSFSWYTTYSLTVGHHELWWLLLHARYCHRWAEAWERCKQIRKYNYCKWVKQPTWTTKALLVFSGAWAFWLYCAQSGNSGGWFLPTISIITAAKPTFNPSEPKEYSSIVPFYTYKLLLDLFENFIKIADSSA